MAANAYRDALSAVRVPYEEQRDRALARSGLLSKADRRGLPTRLRAELAAQEAALVDAVRTVDEVRAAELLLAQYEQTVGAALEYSEQRRALKQRGAQQWRATKRVATVMVAVLTPALTWWGTKVAARHGDHGLRCSKSYLCQTYGRCQAKLSAAVFDRDPAWDGNLCGDDDCRVSCERFGRCELLYGSCRAVESKDCVGSQRCRDLGECTWHDGRCVVGTVKDCQQSHACRAEGLCSVGKSACVANRAEDCLESDACHLEGRCRARRGRCVLGVPRTDPCEAECKLFGRCSQLQGHCVAIYDSQCHRSDDCTDWGLCEAEEGRCVANHSAHCQRATVCKQLEQCSARDGRCVRQAIQ